MAFFGTADAPVVSTRQRKPIEGVFPSLPSYLSRNPLATHAAISQEHIYSILKVISQFLLSSSLARQSPLNPIT